MNGILIINKPRGITSHDVVNIVRRAYKTKKVGHVGTLDPIASGVLVVCVNQATKLAPYLESDDKVYECEVLVGKATDTYDITGTVTEEVEEEEEVFNLTTDEVDKCLLKFKGELEQYPPIYSAIKVNGKKLYQYARNNEEVLIEARRINVFEIKRTSELYEREGEIYFKFKAHVSKGTYIRSLVYDIGKMLNIPCCMSDLIRIKGGKFNLEQSYTIEDVEIGKSCLVKMADSISMPLLDITKNIEILSKVKNGMKLSLSSFDEKYKKIAFIYKDELFAIYEFNDELFPCYKASRVWLD